MGFDALRRLHCEWRVMAIATRSVEDGRSHAGAWERVGERAILETRFRYPGKFMFHAHQSEFAELGWMGLFEAVGTRRDT